MSNLKAAGYLDSPSRGVWLATERGRELLAQHPDGFSEEVGKQIRLEYRQRNRGARHDDVDTQDDTRSTSGQTRDELIDAALNEIHDAVRSDLLDRVASASPAFFEQLVLDLLHRLGYGTSEDDLQRIGGFAPVGTCGWK